MDKNVLVIGSTCVDVIIRVDHLPRTEENLHPESQRFAIGGCAYNVANILGRAGAPTTFVTPVGLQGVFGGFVEKQLQTLSFAQPVLLPDEANGCCYCLVEASGERTFMSIHGAEYSFNPAWMAPYAANHYAYGYVCGLEVEEKTGGLLVDYLKNAPIDRIFYAPGPRGAGIAIERQNALYALHPILHLNGAEASALSGLDGLDESLLFLHEKTQAPVIATLGSLGARVLTMDGALLTVPELSRRACGGHHRRRRCARRSRSAGAFARALAPGCRGIGQPHQRGSRSNGGRDAVGGRLREAEHP